MQKWVHRSKMISLGMQKCLFNVIKMYKYD